MIGVIVTFGTLLAAFALSGLWWWFAFTLALLAVLGAFELLAVRRTGLTLSGQYTRLVRERPLVGGLVSAAIGALFGYLLFHLVSGW